MYYTGNHKGSTERPTHHQGDNMEQIKRTADLRVGDRVVCFFKDNEEGIIDIAGEVAWMYEPKNINYFGADLRSFHVGGRRIGGIKTSGYRIFRLDETETVNWTGWCWEVVPMPSLQIA
jgi:hypothetical protein